MNKQKELYVSPETEALVIRFEGVICQSPTGEQLGDPKNWSGKGGWV